jgi:hypothetical protein
MLLLTALAPLSSLLFYHKHPDVPTKKKDRIQRQIEAYVKDEYISEVIARSKYPYIIAAIKLTESGLCGPYVRGDNGKSRGLYQIQPQHWSFYRGQTAETQTISCVMVLEELGIERSRLFDVIRRYNGSGPAAHRYAKRVMVLAGRIQRTHI